MTDPHPRFIVRESYGVTVGSHSASYDFLILDSWYGYGVVEWLKLQRGNAATLRRRVHAHAAVLNDPPVCGCGCGRPVPIRLLEPGYSGHQARYASEHCKGRAKWQRELESRGRLS